MATEERSLATEETPLRSDEEDESFTKPSASDPTQQRWPWLCLCALLGVIVVFFQRGGSTTMLNAEETGCGGFSSLAAPPLVRRTLAPPVRNVLVTGGAGFIGSHFALMLLDAGGYNVTVVDDLSRGSIETIIRLQDLAAHASAPFQFANLDVSRQFEMERLLRSNRIEAVVHFSGNAYVGESMVRPEDYFQNITASTVSLLRAMGTAGVNKLIFSSSCATFGAPRSFPITEQTPQRPSNPYGTAKLQAEQAIIAFANAQQRQGAPFSAALLRYFNVIGADPRGRMGPHLRHKANQQFPRIVDAAYDVALGQRKQLTVTGSTLKTKDGSAERDYIHVSLFTAHQFESFRCTPPIRELLMPRERERERADSLEMIERDDEFEMIN